MKNEIIKELKIRSIKMFDMSFTVSIQIITAFILACYIEIFHKNIFLIENEKKSSLLLSLEIIFQISIICICSYILRNILELIPSPFHNVYSYDHFRLKELKNAPLITVIIIYFSNSLREKMDILQTRFFPSITKTKK